MKIALVVSCLIAFAFASAPAASRPDSGIEAIGPAPVKLQFHAPAQYPVQQPLWNPYYGFPAAGFPGAPFVHPAVAAAAAAATGYGAFNPYLAAVHPAFNPYAAYGYGFPAQHNPATAAFTGPQVAPYFGGFTEEEAEISDKSAPAADASNPWAEAQGNWNNYFAGPTSEYTWPGAPEAAPGVHPIMGGRLNPFNPLGAPSHPYPFPMHQGVKNGPRHPRPFTSTGEYYPGQSEIPPQFFPSPFGIFGASPFGFPAQGFGFPGQAPYFPAAKNGKMN